MSTLFTQEKLKEVQQSLTVFKEQNLNLTKQVNKSIQDIADKEKHISLLLSQIGKFIYCKQPVHCSVLVVDLWVYENIFWIQLIF